MSVFIIFLAGIFLLVYQMLYSEILLICFLKVSNYEKELEDMKNMTRQEFVASLRRYINHFRSLHLILGSGFSELGHCARTKLLNSCRVINFSIL